MSPEERLTKVEEHLLVTAEMMRRNEERWAEKLDRLTGLMHRIELRLDQHGVRQEHAEEHLTRIETSVATLVETVNRFIQGHGGNGHHER